MSVKVLIERHVTYGHEQPVYDLLKQLRAHCLDQSGYIQGETLRDAMDPSHLLVISHWFGLGHWRQWESSAVRRELDQKVRAHLESDPVVRVYLEGLSEEISGA